MQGFMEAKDVEDRRAVSADEVEATKDQRDVPEAKMAEVMRNVSEIKVELMNRSWIQGLYL